MAVQEQKLGKAQKQSKQTGRALPSQATGETKSADVPEQDELLQLEVEHDIREDIGRHSRALTFGARQGRSMESKMLMELSKKKPRKAPVKKPWSLAKQWANERQWTGEQSEEGAEVGSGGLEPE